MRLQSVVYCIVGCFLAGIPTISAESENLEPVQSAFLFPAEVLTSYQRVFAEGFRDDVLLSVMVSNSLRKELLAGIRTNDEGQYEVFLVSLLHPSHAYKLNKSGDESYNATVLVLPIAKKLFLLMKEIWASELRKVRYPEDQGIRLDGILYTFNMNGSSPMSGQSYTPGGRKMRIIQVADLLVSFIQGDLAENELVEEILKRYVEFGGI